MSYTIHTWGVPEHSQGTQTTLSDQAAALLLRLRMLSQDEEYLAPVYDIVLDPHVLAGDMIPGTGKLTDNRSYSRLPPEETHQ